MKRALLALVLVVPSAWAGPDEKGARIGGTILGVKQSDEIAAVFPGVHSNGGFSFGTFVTFRATPNVALQLEGTFSDKWIATEHCNPSPCVTVADISLFYFEAPVLLRIDLLPDRTKFHFDLGGELVMSLGGSSVDKMTGDKSQLDMTPGNLGPVVGAGVEIGAGPGRVTIDFRYKRWIIPITNNDDESLRLKSTNQVVLEVGYAFP